MPPYFIRLLLLFRCTCNVRAASVAYSKVRACFCFWCLKVDLADVDLKVSASLPLHGVTDLMFRCSNSPAASFCKHKDTASAKHGWPLTSI